MGIPLYFNKITNHYKNIISPHKQKCNRLFLDFNGIIHNVYQTIKKDVDTNMNKEDFENLLNDKVVEYMEYVCSYANPKELVYICIDGVAPMPKIQQQRKRRYLSAWMKSQIREEGYQWDSNAISPGTDYMKKLNVHLRNYIKNKPRSYEVILSDSSCKGEGEHKIFDYIHYHMDTKSIDVIYGLDADLIMLSIICNKSKKFLLREPQHYHRQTSGNTNPFLWFNVQQFKENLMDYYENKIDVHSYVFLCFLIGNDFLPNTTYLTIHNDGITKILNAYRTVLEKFKTPLIQITEKDTYVIDFNTLTCIFEELFNDEDSEMKRLHNQYYEKSMIFKSHKLKLENYGVSHKEVKTKNMFDDTNWRMYYYSHLFDMNQYSDNIINKACNMYVSGLQWITDYYFNKKSSSNWYYIYDYSPTILDIYNYLEVNKNNMLGIDDKEVVISPDLQLLMIIPYISIEVLPKELQDIVKEAVQIGHYYPINFKICSYMKTKLHECIPILPQLNVSEIQIAYLNMIS
jgi:5'-3' exonuclease